MSAAPTLSEAAQDAVALWTELQDGLDDLGVLPEDPRRQDLEPLGAWLLEAPTTARARAWAHAWWDGGGERSRLLYHTPGWLTRMGLLATGAASSLELPPFLLCKLLPQALWQRYCAWTAAGLWMPTPLWNSQAAWLELNLHGQHHGWLEDPYIQAWGAGGERRGIQGWLATAAHVGCGGAVETGWVGHSQYLLLLPAYRLPWTAAWGRAVAATAQRVPCRGVAVDAAAGARGLSALWGPRVPRWGDPCPLGGWGGGVARCRRLLPGGDWPAALRAVLHELWAGVVGDAVAIDGAHGWACVSVGSLVLPLYWDGARWWWSPLVWGGLLLSQDLVPALDYGLDYATSGLRPVAQPTLQVLLRWGWGAVASDLAAGVTAVPDVPELRSAFLRTQPLLAIPADWPTPSVPGLAPGPVPQPATLADWSATPAALDPDVHWQPDDVAAWW